MNRIAREHDPVSRLPDDLQHQLDGQQRVTLTLDSDDDLDAKRPKHLKSLEDLFAFGAPIFGSLDEIVSHVRSLRDD